MPIRLIVFAETQLSRVESFDYLSPDYVPKRDHKTSHEFKSLTRNLFTPDFDAYCVTGDALRCNSSRRHSMSLGCLKTRPSTRQNNSRVMEKRQGGEKCPDSTKNPDMLLPP